MSKTKNMKRLEIDEKKVKLIRTALYVLAGVVAFIILDAKFTFGFVPLFILLALFLLLPVIAKPKAPLFYVIAIVAFGALSLHSLDNYINPEKQVFTNNDHHALRLDGVRIDNPVKDGFLLAGDSEKAFFDDDSFRGSLKIVDLTDESVVLLADDFTRPIYRKRSFKGKYSDKTTNLIEDALPLFSADDDVIIYSKSKDENGRRRKISFSIKEFDSASKDSSDYCNYVFVSKGGESKTSSTHTFLTAGLSLADLATDVILDFDPEGIAIVRNYTNLDAPRTKLLNRKKEGPYDGKFYSFDIDSKADVSEISVNGKVYTVDGCKSKVEIPLNVPFYIGSRNEKTASVVFRKRHAGDTLCLEYELPMYRYLSSIENQVENTLMITSTLFDSSSPDNLELTSTYTDNILLFDVFDRQNNRNQITPSYLSFVTGKSSELLDYDFIVADNRYDGQRSLDYVCDQNDVDFIGLNDPSDSLAFYSKTKFVHLVPTIGNKGVTWMMAVENFKKTTPYASWKISLLLLCVIMICSLVFMYRFEDNRFYTEVEYISYLILIAFLTIRMFLMWRMTVFPPVTSISYYEFNLFRTSVPLGWFIRFFAFFIVGVVGMKVWIANRKQYKAPEFTWLKKVFTPTWRMYVTIPIAYALGFFMPYVLPASAERICNIMIPVAIAVVFEILIHSLYARTYISDLKKMDPKNPIGARRNPILMSMLNLGLASGVTFLKDGGYGVMFIVFSLLYLVYKFLDLRLYTPQNRNSSKATVCKYILFLFAILFVALYKDIFIFLYNHRITFFIIAFVVITILTGLVLVVLDVRWSLKSWKPWVCVAIIAAGCTAVWAASYSKIDGKHMEYRIRVHMEKPENTLAYHIKSKQAQSRFMQASINDWILDEYAEIGKEIKVLGEGGNGYFKMQPQSKVGALWFAQTTDIILSRFIIAEHSQLLAILFIVAFVIMLAVALMIRTERRWTKMIMVMIPLLFATQAMLIWLANTGRFIFFGQDFPLISATSKLSIIYFFFLLLVMVIASLVERMPHSVREGDSDWKAIEKKNLSLMVQIILVFVFVMMIFLFSESIFIYEALIAYIVINLIWQYYRKRNRNNRRRQSEDDDENAFFSSLPELFVHILLFAALTFGFFQLNKLNKGPEKMRGEYNVGSLMRTANSDIETINHYLKAYQKDNKMTLKTDMYNQMVGFQKYLEEQELACMDINNGMSFTRLIFDEFVKNDSRQNTVTNLLHVRNERSYNSKGRSADTLVLALRADYFSLSLPKRQSMGWKGNVIEYQNKPVVNDKKTVTRKGDVLILDGSCVYGNQDVLLASVHKGKDVRIIGPDALVDVTSKNLPVGRVNNTDILVVDGRKIDTPIDGVNYYARNVMVNGQRTFLYPKGSELFWIRDFASQIQNAKNSTPKSKRDKDTYHDDLELTLDGELVTSIYSAYLKNAEARGGDRTVVVADGNGHIKAMVDFRKDQEFRLNPNDNKRISEVMEDLQLNGEIGKTKERKYFEHMAMGPLRLGPGSSQKPLTWTAVSTSYNTDWWDKMVVDKIDNSYLYSSSSDGLSGNDKKAIARNRYLFRHFAGHRIQKSFSSIKNDEGAGAYDISLDYFIRRSSNYYNGVLAYLGAFPVDGYYDNNKWLKVSDDNDGETLFRNRPRYRNPHQYDSLFPILRLNANKDKEVVFNAFLDSKIALDTTALLPLGLSRNLGLAPYTGDRPLMKAITSNSVYPSVKKYRKDTTSSYKWKTVSVVKPGRSYFNLAPRRGHYRDRELNENIVRSVAIGNNTAWQVSPLKMAEMYGRMITMNRNYNLTLEPGAENKYQKFIVDDSWDNLDKYQKTRRGLLEGLSQNFQSNSNIAYQGQAVNARPDSVSIDIPGENVARKYYIYGKTGTIDGLYAGYSMEDHLLAAIITDTKLSTCSADELEHVRFYVVYFADYGDVYQNNNGLMVTQNPSWGAIDKKILNEVILSRDFQNYMNSPKIK